MGPRWTHASSRPHQLLRSHCHVFLLLPDRSAAQTEAINLVEETHNSNPTGKLDDRVNKSSSQHSCFQLQFAVLAVAFSRALLAEACSYPKFWLWMLAVQNTFMFVLFSSFYRKSYQNRTGLRNKFCERTDVIEKNK